MSYSPGPAVQNKCWVQDSLNNPYLQEFLQITADHFKSFSERGKLCKKYSWAVPNDQAIKTLTQYPVTEIGAGKGYWASLISKAGGDIQAYDVKYGLRKSNGYVDDSSPWFQVQALKKNDLIEVVRKAAVSGRTLFICWPEYNKPWAREYLEEYLKNKGPRLVYVGESRRGCCGDDDFHELLAQHPVQKEIEIPRWPGVYDSMEIYEFG